LFLIVLYSNHNNNADIIAMINALIIPIILNSLLP
jgi:hypothetical protein